ncbi:MAG: hypothetical protein D3924_16395, partial [Candidatus Electrothrix sp. AR4]|nr:hypothetical protein [Candidatus Electrothrix sp. AR4]
MTALAQNAAVVRILTDDQIPHKPQGAGFLVTPQHIITCAHVVNDALGRKWASVDPPDLAVFLDFPLLPFHPLVQARVLHWYPMRESAVFGELEDIAILELLPDTPLPAGVHPAPIAALDSDDTGEFDRKVRMYGFPDIAPNGKWADGILQGPTGKGWTEIRHAENGGSVEPGFSGTAVCSAQKNAVCGMTVGMLNSAASYMIPATALFEAFPDMPIPVNPYKGLEAFREEDACFYFGRDEAVTILRKIVENQPFTAVIGASGSGKSSLVFAGLVPALQQDIWLTVDCRPRQQPFYELARCLFPLLYNTELDELERPKKINQCAAKLLSGELKLTELFRRILEKKARHRFLLIVDQFEELYTSNENKALVHSFVDQLLVAAQTDNFRLVI